MTTGVCVTTERREKVVLPYGEKYVVLDDDGTVLRLSKTRPRVTEIRNAIIKNMDKGEIVEIKDKEVFRKSLDVIKEMEKSDLFFSVKREHAVYYITKKIS